MVTNTKIIFTLPFLVNAKLAEECMGRVVVLDVGFNAGSPNAKGTPSEQFAATTMDFINALGNRLVAWVDHHPHSAWQKFANDPRFILVPREQAPACPPLITPELVARFGEYDTIVCHGDFDGVMAAAKWENEGDPLYAAADTDAIAADTRQGDLSPIGTMVDQAMKADIRDNDMRQTVVDWLVGKSNPEIKAQIEDGQRRYQTIQAETMRLITAYTIHEQVAYVDATQASDVDNTQLLLAGQKRAKVAIVRGISQMGPTKGQVQITVACPAGLLDLGAVFGIQAPMANRINLDDQPVNEMIAKINTALADNSD